MHNIELDQFVGPNNLVTVHGPLNPVVNPDVALIDTRQVLRRIERDELHPHSPLELTYSIGSALVRREIDLVAALARESGRLEQRVTDKDHKRRSRGAAGGTCSRSDTNCSRSAPWPRTRTKGRSSLIAPTGSRWCAAWPTGKRSSCTA